jgi:23S rRNA-/tRNA-specific pseudouridylate synthase
VHLSNIGFPLLGDKIYARGSRHYLDFIARGWTKEMESEIWLSRHALHSSRLRINIGAQELEWTSPLPADLARMIELGESCGDLVSVERSAVQ